MASADTLQKMHVKRRVANAGNIIGNSLADIIKGSGENLECFFTVVRQYVIEKIHIVEENK
jgi:hypothetical protein